MASAAGSNVLGRKTLDIDQTMQKGAPFHIRVNLANNDRVDAINALFTEGITSAVTHRYRECRGSKEDQEFAGLSARDDRTAGCRVTGRFGHGAS